MDKIILKMLKKGHVHWTGLEKKVLTTCHSFATRTRLYAGERDLVKKLRKLGYNALRMGVSGAGSEPIPDVVAFHPEKREALAFEVKSVTATKWTVHAYRGTKRKREGQLLKLCAGFS